MPDKPTDEAAETRPFAAILQRLNNGKTMTELALAMQDLTEAVQSTGKPGKLQLTLTVEPTKNNSKVVTVSDQVTVKAPSRGRPSSVFYIDDLHNLRDSDPMQDELPGILEAVASPRPAITPIPQFSEAADQTADGAQA